MQRAAYVTGAALGVEGVGVGQGARAVDGEDGAEARAGVVEARDAIEVALGEGACRDLTGGQLARGGRDVEGDEIGVGARGVAGFGRHWCVRARGREARDEQSGERWER